MKLKLIIVCATLAIVSCSRVDQEQLARQMEQQQEVIQQQNERIRDHRRLEIEQRQEQIRELENQRRRHEQSIRDQEQQRREIVRPVLIAAHPHFIPSAVHFFAVPTSRNFEHRDDSNSNYNYDVNDDVSTDDDKSQLEVPHGDQVQGQYNMMNSDGYQRTVEYRADDKNGFDAEFRREPTSAAIIAHPQFVRIEDNNAYATQYYHHQQPTTFLTAIPTIFSSTSVSRNDDGQRSEYTSRTTSNF